MIPKGFLLTVIGVGVLSESNLGQEWQIIIMAAASILGMLILVMYQRWRENRILGHIDDRIERSTGRILEAIETRPEPPKPTSPKPAPRKRVATKPVTKK